MKDVMNTLPRILLILLILVLNKAIEINSKYAQAYYDRAGIYYLKREYDKSWEDIKKAQDLGYKVSAEFLEDLR